MNPWTSISKSAPRRVDTVVTDAQRDRARSIMVKMQITGIYVQWPFLFKALGGIADGQPFERSNVSNNKWLDEVEGTINEAISRQQPNFTVIHDLIVSKGLISK